LGADIGYWYSGGLIWVTAGLWLLGTGLVTAALAALAGITDFIGDARIRQLSDAWHHAI